MENAKVFLIDDDDTIRKVVREGWLKPSGIPVVLEATSFEEAIERIPQAIELGVNVAIVDGILDPTKYHYPVEGGALASTLRERIPGIKIIGFSVDGVSYGDVNLKKEFQKLRSAIKSL